MLAGQLKPKQNLKVCIRHRTGDLKQELSSSLELGERSAMDI